MCKSHTHVMQLKIGRDGSFVEVLPEEPGVQAQTMVPRPVFQGQEEKTGSVNQQR